MNMMVSEIRPTEAPVSGQAATSVDGFLRAPSALKEDDVTTMSVSQVAAMIVAQFRAHGHISNVMTHISGARWDRVENAIRVILDPSTGKPHLTPLAENIVDLFCAERGVTGRIVKPYFEELLGRLLPADVAALLCAHVACLCGETAMSAQGVKDDGIE